MDDHERLNPEIAGHYAAVSEERRLGTWTLERVRTWELLGRYLPASPAVVLDVGGAAGVYALPLAARGYEVHLVDPVALHVRQALEASAGQPAAPLASATVGAARRLEWPGARVDAVLLLGPLYHLTDRRDRLRALAEARRVLRPGGTLVAAAISRFGSTMDGLLRGYLDEPGFEAIVEGALRDGQHRNPAGRPEWFTTAYFHLPEELGREVTEAGLRLEAVLAVEGPAWMLPDIEERLADPDRRERVLAAIRRVETEPSLLGASAHLLVVAVAADGRPGGASVTEANKAVVRRLVAEVLNGGRLEVIDELYAPELAAATRRWIAPFRASFPDVHMEVVELIAEGDRVVGRFTCSATHLGPWLGQEPTGRRFERVDEVAIFRFRDGRIVDAWSLEDTLGRLRQLGLA